jgi:hypothetical protein
MIAATAVLGHDHPEMTEPSVMEFLNGSTVIRWAAVTLGHLVMVLRVAASKVHRRL